MMAIASSISKCILIIINMIFMLPALAFIGFGIFISVSAKQLFGFINNVLDSIPNSDAIKDQVQIVIDQEGLVQFAGYALIGFGVFLLLLSFLGCVGAIRESSCMLITYSVFLFLLGAAKVSLIVLAITSEASFKNYINQVIKEMQDKSFLSVNDAVLKNNVDKTAITYFVNLIQVTFDCCGAVEVGDIAQSQSWLNSNRNWTTGDTMQLPVTCCPIEAKFKERLTLQQQWRNVSQFLEDENCPVTKEGAHDQVCYDGFVNFVKPYYLIAFGAVIALIFLELLLILFSLCIVCSSKDKRIRRGGKNSVGHA